jgi:hypothetical protein
MPTIPLPQHSMKYAPHQGTTVQNTGSTCLAGSDPKETITLRWKNKKTLWRIETPKGYGLAGNTAIPANGFQCPGF